MLFMQMDIPGQHFMAYIRRVGIQVNRSGFRKVFQNLLRRLIYLDQLHVDLSSSVCLETNHFLQFVFLLLQVYRNAIFFYLSPHTPFGFYGGWGEILRIQSVGDFFKRKMILHVAQFVASI